MTELKVFPYPIDGDPLILLTLTILPTSIGRLILFSSLVVLGLITSTGVVRFLSTLYPLTYALPGDIFKQNKSSDGVFPL